jgi:hypothetical protein
MSRVVELFEGVRSNGVSRLVIVFGMYEFKKSECRHWFAIPYHCVELLCNHLPESK